MGAKGEEISQDERLTRKMSRLKTYSLFQKGKLEAKMRVWKSEQTYVFHKLSEKSTEL